METNQIVRTYEGGNTTYPTNAYRIACLDYQKVAQIRNHFIVLSRFCGLFGPTTDAHCLYQCWTYRAALQRSLHLMPTVKSDDDCKFQLESLSHCSLCRLSLGDNGIEVCRHLQTTLARRGSLQSTFQLK